MSIIHEALKKTQNNLKTTPAPNTSRPAQPPAQSLAPLPVQQATPPSVQPAAPVIHRESVKPTAPSEQQTKTTENHPLRKALPFGKIILALLGLTLLFILQPYLTARVSSITSTPQMSLLAPAASAPIVERVSAIQPPAVDQAPVVPPPPVYSTPVETPVIAVRPQLILNGISSAGIKPMALINNEIYEIGDDVNGLRIVNITEDGVELMDRDQRIFLKKRR